MTFIREEYQHELNKVSGRMGAIHKWDNGLHMHQTWTSEHRAYNGGKSRLQVKIRFDDNCRNGHNSFAITADGDDKTTRGTWRESIGGCCHDEIARVFPELKPLIKWHCHSTDGGIHAVANASYHASNRDCHGLLKGESKQIVNGKTKQPCWELVATIEGEKLTSSARYADGVKPTSTVKAKWVPLCRIGEGKERDFKAARNCFPTIDLSDNDLMLEKAELKALLTSHLKASIADFKRDIKQVGFEWVEST